ncbi:hypothetical protein [Xenorhabdus bovienii]|uniref:hypothetical protein n=1 Tax=Xenorhabdus bovienii TaxID=40576 RepID=UPI0023B2B791|nr:hypothetical protein [Xenorhabdus bovienii]MDE9483458.1 hypothetical protein [Xenorhabdus bovienii]
MLDEKNQLNPATEPVITVSVINGADVAIGQEFYVDITVSSESPLANNLNITTDNPVGLKHLDTSILFVLSSDRLHGYMTIYCAVLGEDKITAGEKNVSYDIKVSGKKVNTITYNAKKLLPYTIQLDSERKVCVTPTVDQPLDHTNDNYIRFYATVLDSNHKIMKNMPIQVSSSMLDNKLDRVTIASDPSDNKVPNKISPITDNGQPFFTVCTSDKGVASFRVYPMKNKQASLSLSSYIFGSNYNYTTEMVFIITPAPEESRFLLWIPYVPAANGGVLAGKEDQKTFNVQIGVYDNISEADSILFFTKSKNGMLDPDALVLPVQTIQEASNPTYTFTVPYDILPVNQWTDFYYIVASDLGSSKYSRYLEIKYSGGSSNLPSDNVNRIYNKPVVYSSFADYQTDPLLNSKDADEAKIFEHDYINQGDISNYIKNNGFDIYVKIIGSLNDEPESVYPLAGEEVYLSVYVNSKTKILHKAYKQKLSITADIAGQPYCTTIIPIKHPNLAGIVSYHNGISGWIYLEYYTINKESGAKKYSKIWRNMIETSLGFNSDDN